MTAKPRLLFVDDEREILDLLCLMFHDFEPETALNADAALELLREKRFDVLITDIRMPGSSGLTLMANATALYPDIKVILMTGYHQDVPTDVEQKVARLILKPFSISTMRTAVLEVLRAQHERP